MGKLPTRIAEPFIIQATMHVDQIRRLNRSRITTRCRALLILAGIIQNEATVSNEITFSPRGNEMGYKARTLVSLIRNINGESRSRRITILLT